MYSIVDIETTGGKPSEEAITEIAIYKFDGKQIVDQFISLLNPQRDIQFFVQNLTGITPKMVRTAPKFYEVAKRIVEITEGTILVAHNADFDYGVIKNEFKRLGFQFELPTLDTVSLSRKLIPNQESYSLGKLCRAIGIPISDRHRAAGDAIATIELFKLLLAKDSGKIIEKSIKRVRKSPKISSKLLDMVNDLPNENGVFYVYDNRDNLVYIGRSGNIKNQVSYHLSATDKVSKKIQEFINVIRFELTGSEIIALIKESAEIKIHQPSINGIQKKSYPYGIFHGYSPEGYQILYINKINSRSHTPILNYATYEEAKQVLFQITEDYKLCPKINQLKVSEKECINYKKGKCLGACLNQEEKEIYNQRVEDFLKKIRIDLGNKLLIDRGRNSLEKSFLWIENGIFKGYGYSQLHHQLENKLENIIIPIQETYEIRLILRKYLMNK